MSGDTVVAVALVVGALVVLGAGLCMRRVRHAWARAVPSLTFYRGAPRRPGLLP